MEVALFSIVSIYVTAELTNRVAAGLNREKSIFIVSPQAKAICSDIMENVHRGATFIDGRGGFAEEPKNILFVVVSLTQVSRVKTIVAHHDPQAFMIVSDTSEVSGKGFTLACESYEDARRKWQQTHEKQLEFEQLHGEAREVVDDARNPRYNKTICKHVNPRMQSIRCGTSQESRRQLRAGDEKH